MPKAKYKSYVICTTPRSGSTLLCKLLAATGKSGNPDSHFHHPSMSDWLKAFALARSTFATDHDALIAIFDAALKRGTGNTKLFGLRLQRGSFEFFMQQADIFRPGLSSDLKRFQAVFGHTLFIHLTRQNKLDQAISRVKATQSGLWHKAADGTELERLSSPQELVYDAAEIERHLEKLIAWDEAWKVWFTQEKIDPVLITYDEISANPTKVLESILGQLGLKPALAHGITPQVAKLADATNRKWATRFVAEKGDGRSQRY